MENPGLSTADPYPCYINSIDVGYTYKWQIQDPFYQKCNISSPEFCPDGNGQVKWRLDLEFDQWQLEYCRIYLTLVSCKKGKLRAKADSMISHSDNKPLIRQSGCEFEYEVGAQHQNISYTYKILHALNKDIFVHCRIIMPALDLFYGKNVSSDLKTNGKFVLNSFYMMLDSPNFSDVVLNVGGKEIRAHKCILAARSEVFRAMFSHPMQEASLNSVNIEDADYEPMLEMLRYIYTGLTPNFETMVKELLVLADKYALDGLQRECEEHIFTNLSAKEVPDILEFAHMFSPRLLKNVQDFIISNSLKVDKSPRLDTLLKNPEFAMDFLAAFFK